MRALPFAGVARRGDRTQRRLAAKKKKVKKKKPTCVDATCRTEHDGAYYHKIKCLANWRP